MQITVLNFSAFYLKATSIKTLEVFLKILKNGGMMLIALYVRNEHINLRVGYYLLLPEDYNSFLKKSLQYELNIYSTFCPSIFTVGTKVNTLTNLMRDYLYLWKKDALSPIDMNIKNAFFQKVHEFLNKSKTKRISIKELNLQVQIEMLKENAYQEVLKKLVGYTRFQKFDHGNGDIRVSLNNNENTVIETKKAVNHNSGRKSSKSYRIQIRKEAYGLMDYNTVDALIIAIAKNRNLSDTELIKEEAYKYLLIIPTRTRKGMINLSADNPAKQQLSFNFDLKNPLDSFSSVCLHDKQDFKILEIFTEKSKLLAQRKILLQLLLRYKNRPKLNEDQLNILKKALATVANKEQQAKIVKSRKKRAKRLEKQNTKKAKLDNNEGDKGNEEGEENVDDHEDEDDSDETDGEDEEEDDGNIKDNYEGEDEEDDDESDEGDDEEEMKIFLSSFK
jgi:hypothetical protein